MLAVSHMNHHAYRRRKPWRARWALASAKRSGCRYFAAKPSCSCRDMRADGATSSMALHAGAACDNFEVANAAADPQAGAVFRIG